MRTRRSPRNQARLWKVLAKPQPQQQESPEMKRLKASLAFARKMIDRH